MDDYRQYKPEQLAADASFRRWKLDQNKEDTLLWESWLLRHPGKLSDVERAERLLEIVANSYDQPDENEVKAEMRRIAAKLSDEEVSEEQEQQPRSLWRKLAGIAAAAVLLLAGWQYLNTGPVAEKPDESALQAIASEHHMKTETNSSGRKKLVLLPDGSTVLMMPNSTIHYPDSFSGITRDVNFSGEAFFEIERNPSQPFFVYTDKFVTKVLGTSFTIRSYEGEEASVTVKTGSVSVFRSSSEAVSDALEENAVVLTPNEKLTFSTDEPLVVRKIPKESVNASIGSGYTGLEFTGTPVGEVFAALESVYQVPIRFDTTAMKNCFLTASLEHEPFFKKLDLICRTLDAHYEVRPDGDIMVSGSGCD